MVNGAFDEKVLAGDVHPRPAAVAEVEAFFHSRTAVNDLAPASTAATVAINNDARLCRTPRGSRGSGTRARSSARPGHWPASSARSPAGRHESCSRAAPIGDNKAGAVFHGNHWIRHPTSSRKPCLHKLPEHRNGYEGINRTSRHYTGARIGDEDEQADQAKRDADANHAPAECSTFVGYLQEENPPGHR